MSFEPYHQFRNCTLLENLVSDYSRNGSIPNEMAINFFRYHQGLIQKLKSTKLNIEGLETLLTNTNASQAASNPIEMFFQANFFMDGFFYNSGSSLDILARIVLTLFNEPLPTKVYFETAQQKISRSRPLDPILNRLTVPLWKTMFSDYRNTLTHEVLLLNRYTIQVENYGAVSVSKIIIPLPDNPRALQSVRTYQTNQNVIEYSKDIFKKILSLSNLIYGDICHRAKVNHTLPI